ncbi:MAG: hypothetical protein Kow0047_02270 [Anaerolineae bacterium]
MATTYPFEQPSHPQFDERYHQAIESLQAGKWRQAIDLLEDLEKDYPGNSEISQMLSQARIKANLAQRVSIFDRIRIPRQVTRFLKAIAVIALTLAAIWVVFVVYDRVIMPTQVAQAQKIAQQQLLREGQDALAVGAYSRAYAAFSQLLQEVPDSEAAREGLAIAEHYLTLDKQYEEAKRLESEGRTQEAIALYRDIEATEPGYRDVTRRIETLERRLKIEQAYAAGVHAFKTANWADAIEAFELVRSLSISYREEEITQRLYEAYIRRLEEMLFPSGDVAVESDGDIHQAVEEALSLVKKALSLRPRDERATQLRAHLQDFLIGDQAFQRGNWRDAVEAFERIYQMSPRFLEGYLPLRLYQAHLRQGELDEAAENYVDAFLHYRRACYLDAGIDTTEACRHMQAIALLATPTPTATPTPQPTATPTPTPTPLPLAAYRGWIAFKTDRDGGVSIYVMRPDGSGQRPVADPEKYTELEEREAYSPDGTRRVYNEGDRQSTPLYIWRYDVPPQWEHRRQLLDNSSINYQPAWSPVGNLIAFVSQKSGNDDIWVISADESIERPEPKRLTWNNWEWDKHPTWSPDGQYIAFWSNRETGRRQIWLMKADGSGQVNISNNEYNDWDPVWIK